MAQFISSKQVIILLAFLGQLLSVSVTIAAATATTTEGSANSSQQVRVEPEGDTGDTEVAPLSLVEVKIGFLVGSRRLDRDHTYSRPGRQLKYAFNYAIDKFNRFNSDVASNKDNAAADGGDDDDVDVGVGVADEHNWRDRNQTKTTIHVDDGSAATQTPLLERPSSSAPSEASSSSSVQASSVSLSSSSSSSSSRPRGGSGIDRNSRGSRRRRHRAAIKIKFAPIIRETYGSESESIKQTIELITKHGVNFIFGPQETCQMEPKLASVFNVAMLSHYCTTWAHRSAPSSSWSADTNDGGATNSRESVAVTIGGGNQNHQRIITNRHQSSDFDGNGNGIGGGHLLAKSSPQSPLAATVAKSTPVTTKQPQPLSRSIEQQSRKTFIQIKPPHWKIVSRVVSLVEQLLAVSSVASSSSSISSVVGNDNSWSSSSGDISSNTNNSDGDNSNSNKDHHHAGDTLYPQQLVLLYFRQPSQPPSTDTKQKPNRSEGSSHLETTAANDAIQYRLIGELLEIKLNQLIAKAKVKAEAAAKHHEPNKRRKRRQPPTLSTLNWHTTFHYGYTKNPFRAVLRRHLFRAQQSQSAPITNQSAASAQQRQQCNHLPAAFHGSGNKSPLDQQQQQRQRRQRRQFTPKAARQTEAIYIVVGHYYEHLGLMLALNELNLLASSSPSPSPSSAASSTSDQATAEAAQESIQSSVGMTPTAAAATMMRQRSVVIGVDTEPYDERDDSVRFLRGLLMDSVVGGQPSSSSASSSSSSSSSMSSADDLDLDSISALYRAYLGVVPAKPTHLTEFLDEMRSLYSNETLSPSPAFVASAPANAAIADSIHESLTALTSNNNQTHQQQQQEQQLQLSARLLQFIRLPVEAFYLYDAVMLLGLYLKDCLLKWGPMGLEKCSQGDRTFEWFRGRDYVSHVTHNWSRFDSMAQADGSYNLITRRKQTPIDLLASAGSSNQDEDFAGSGSGGGFGSSGGGGSTGTSSATLIPIGYFSSSARSSSNEGYAADSDSTSTTDCIELQLSWDEIDPIWLPFWCHVKKNFTSAACLHLFQASTMQTNRNNSLQMDYEYDDDDELVATKQLNLDHISGSLSSLKIVSVVATLAMLLASYMVYCCCANNQPNKRRGLRSKNFNAGWFNELDERNFSELIYRYLLAPEANESLVVVSPDAELEQQQRQPNQRRDLIEIHCNMFAFPSCMFVHWLTAMYQLKEMLFKFKANSSQTTEKAATASLMTEFNKLLDGSSSSSSSRFTGLIRAIMGKATMLIRLSATAPLPPSSIERQFFSIKHSGTNSLRLLLNKYKSINECLINLSQLDHTAVAKLYGITMSCSVAMAPTSRRVFLVLAQPDRGNLRQAIGQLMNSSVNCSANRRFRLGGKMASLSWLEFKESLLVSLVGDLLDGLEHLHKSAVRFHGDLRTTTCLVSYNWRLRLSGFHENHLRRSLGDYEQKLTPDSKQSAGHFDQLIYSAPELIQNHLRRFSISAEGMQLADIYSFAFVAFELLSDGREPWSSCTSVRDSRLLVERVKDDASFRPSLSKLDLVEYKMFDAESMQRTIRSCWSYSPERRPQSVELLRQRFCVGSGNAAATRELMHVYTKLIESSCSHQKRCLSGTRRQILGLKLRLLPANIVARLALKQTVRRQHFECISFGMFRLVLADGGSSTADPIERLSQFVGEMMRLVDQYHNQLHLLESQADSLLRFMVFSGEPLEAPQQRAQEQQNQSPLWGFAPPHHSQLIASFALQLVDLASRLQAAGNLVQVRCGLHCGPAFGGLLGASEEGDVLSVRSPSYRCNSLARYILIGPSMLVANLLEQTSQSQRIQISAEFRTQLLLTQRLSPSMSLSLLPSSSLPTATLGGRTNDELDSCQGYVIIKREARIQPARMFAGISLNGSSVAAEFESYWLLNGPRLTASQSLMLLTRSCDTARVTNQSGEMSSDYATQDDEDQVEGIDDSDDYDVDLHQHHSHDWTNLPPSSP